MKKILFIIGILFLFILTRMDVNAQTILIFKGDMSVRCFYRNGVSMIEGKPNVAIFEYKKKGITVFTRVVPYRDRIDSIYTKDNPFEEVVLKSESFISYLPLEWDWAEEKYKELKSQGNN